MDLLRRGGSGRVTHQLVAKLVKRERMIVGEAETVSMGRKVYLFSFAR